MLDDKIDEITAQIQKLEDELTLEFKKKEKEFFSKIESEKAEFEERVIKNGKEKINSSINYLSSLPLGVALTLPFIWIMIIPAMFTDLMVTIYQTICFPIYKIPKVKRKDYVVLDRYNLFYLGRIEKINCFYCEYFNGVAAYVREIAARTEQLWCPIKHAKQLKGPHSRYHKFIRYGDYTEYTKSLEKRRNDFKDIEN